MGNLEKKLVMTQEIAEGQQEHPGSREYKGRRGTYTDEDGPPKAPRKTRERGMYRQVRQPSRTFTWFGNAKKERTSVQQELTVTGHRGGDRKRVWVTDECVRKSQGTPKPSDRRRDGTGEKEGKKQKSGGFKKNGWGQHKKKLGKNTFGKYGNNALGAGGQGVKERTKNESAKGRENGNTGK